MLQRYWGALVWGVLCLTLASVGHAQDAPLRTLKPGHPRLLVDAHTWARVQTQRRADRTLDRLLRRLEADGRALFEAPPVRHEKQGRRLLDVSREVLRRVLLLSVDYRLTGNKEFLDRAAREMLAAAAFADWNPSHFLDTAEMTAALALGYDWLFDALDPPTRETIRQAIAEKGLRPAAEPKLQWGATNWNAVCWSGLVLGALAVADEEPALAADVLTQAKENYPEGMTVYAPDGVYPEGPQYWSYGTTYEVLLIGALESALGTDFGLAASPGFLASAGAYLQSTGPSGRAYNYADGVAALGVEPALFWFARRLGQPSLLRFQWARLDTLVDARSPVDGRTLSSSDPLSYLRFLPLVALWWSPPSTTAPPLPTRWRGRGATPLTVFRTSWTDPKAMWLALKGGRAAISHGHMDAGSFVLEADGVRWGSDLGREEYDPLEARGLKVWDVGQQADRWQVFRLNNLSHSTLTINGRLHRAEGEARLVQFSDEGRDSRAVLDLSPVFAGQASRVTRGFQFRPGNGVLVEDELEGLNPGDTVRWAMVTTAEATLDGPRAELRKNSRTLHARLLAPANARFEVIAADPPHEYDTPNSNTRLLTVNAIAPVEGRLRIAVFLQPGSAHGAAPAVLPLDRWSAPSAEQATRPSPAAVLEIMERVADWQLAHPAEHPATDWTQAAGYAGMMALSEIAPSQRFEEAMVRMGETNVWQLGPSPYLADDHAVGQTYVELYLRYRDPRMIAPLRARFDSILAHPPKDNLRTDGAQNPEPGTGWWWCDALFMAPPVWARLATATGDTTYRQFMVAQWWKTSDYLYDKDVHLYFRDDRHFARREANGRKVLWSRGNGWVMAGLVRVLQYLPTDHPARARFVQQFREMATRILTLQQPDGLWRASLLDPDHYPVKETSGSGFFVYALAWGINQGLLDRSTFEPAVLKGWTALEASVEPEGKLIHVQPIGEDPRHFDETHTDVYGVGAFLLAGSEVYRLAGGAPQPDVPKARYSPAAR